MAFTLLGLAVSTPHAFWRFIHVVKCNSNLFLFIAKQPPLCGYITVCGLVSVSMFVSDNTESYHLSVTSPFIDPEGLM